jgi:hypothetical protein
MSDHCYPNYIIVKARNTEDLASLVNSMMEYGYVPCGGAAYTGTSAYMQSMVRRAP